MNLAKSDSHPDRYVATPTWTAWAVFASLTLHGLAYGSLSGRPISPPKRHPESVVAFEVTTPALPEPLPTPNSAQPEPEPAAAARRVEPTRTKEAPKTEVPEPPAAAETVDMSGLTLTNDRGVGFAMPTGNGLSREGALRVPASLGREKPAPTETAPVARNGPDLVPVSDLSSRPTPPALDGALERNYPDEARRRGLGGTATVRLRIEPDGVVRQVTALNETSPGFGEACRRTLRGSRWSAPRDRNGRSVATEVRYTCRFLVTR